MAGPIQRNVNRHLNAIYAHLSTHRTGLTGAQQWITLYMSKEEASRHLVLEGLLHTKAHCSPRLIWTTTGVGQTAQSLGSRLSTDRHLEKAADLSGSQLRP